MYVVGKVISGSKDRTIRLWDLTTARSVAVAKIPNTHSGGGSGGRNRQIWLNLAWLPTGHVISTSIR